MRLKFKILIVILLFSNIFSFSQSLKDDYGYDNLDSAVSSITAVRDVESNRIKLFGLGGISPVAYSSRDSIFEFRYKVKYVLFGCVTPYEIDSMKAYNKEIGKYLDKRYGKAWRKELHPDVIAF